MSTIISNNKKDNTSTTTSIKVTTKTLPITVKRSQVNLPKNGSFSNKPPKVNSEQKNNTNKK